MQDYLCVICAHVLNVVFDTATNVLCGAVAQAVSVSCVAGDMILFVNSVAVLFLLLVMQPINPWLLPAFFPCSLADLL